LGHSINSKPKAISLATDDEGKIGLGLLEHVKYVEATVNDSVGGNISKHWDLLIKEQFNAQDSYDIIEDEVLELPYTLPSFDPSQVSLLQLKDGYPIVSFYKNLKCINKCAFYNVLQIFGLKEGSYNLRVGNNTSYSKIEVHRGIYWETEKFILK